MIKLFTTGFICFFLCTFSVFGQNEKRIISLAPSLTKNVYFLGAQDELVGCTSYCTEAVADGKEIIASAIKVNLEKAVSLKPDLVIVSSLTDPETIESFRKFGIRVEVFPSPVSFNSICGQFIQIGKLLDKEETAIEIVNKSKLKIEQLQKELPANNPGNYFFQIGADPIFTVLPNTFMNDYILLTGGRNISEGLTKGTVTRESIVAQNPDYIFIVTMGIAGEEEQKTWNRFSNMEAVKNNAVFLIDADKACSPTPITFTETFETILSCLKQLQ